MKDGISSHVLVLYPLLSPIDVHWFFCHFWPPLCCNPDNNPTPNHCIPHPNLNLNSLHTSVPDLAVSKKGSEKQLNVINCPRFERKTRKMVSTLMPKQKHQLKQIHTPMIDAHTPPDSQKDNQPIWLAAFALPALFNILFYLCTHHIIHMY